MWKDGAHATSECMHECRVGSVLTVYRLDCADVIYVFHSCHVIPSYFIDLAIWVYNPAGDLPGSETGAFCLNDCLHAWKTCAGSGFSVLCFAGESMDCLG